MRYQGYVTTWRRFPVLLLVFLWSLTGLPTISNSATWEGKLIDLCAFHPTFAENFEDFTVSPWGDGNSRWIAHTPWAGDFGDAAFADPTPGFPFKVAGGTLSIEARKGADGRWQSGLLASADPKARGFAQLYGYFEIDAKLPAGPGLWPAFWLDTALPQGSKQPSVEIDIMEHYGAFPGNFHSVLHIWNKGSGEKDVAIEHVTRVPSGSLYQAFHTYGADVEPDWITIYFDRKAVWRVATPDEMVKPSLVLFNLALGSGWPIDKTPNPSIMQVKYVHVFERVLAEGSGCLH